MPLQFLVELAQKPLPLAVTCPRQLGHVTRLKAIGLIEATLALSHSRDRRTHAALVHHVTESGVREIMEATGHAPTPMRRCEPNSVGLTFLRFLEHADLPVIVTQDDERNIAARLLLGGLIHGAVDDVSGDARATVIRGLTAAGRAALSVRMRKDIAALRPRAHWEPVPGGLAASRELTTLPPHAPVMRHEAVHAMD
jgi:hypothetical protein